MTHFAHLNNPTLVTKMEDDCPPNWERFSTRVVKTSLGSRNSSRIFFFFFLSFQPPSKYRANYSTRSFNSGTTVHYMNRIYPRLYVRWVMAGVHHRGGACIWRRATVCMCLVSRYKKNNFLRVADQNVVTRTLQVKKREREREREIGLRTER